MYMSAFSIRLVVYRMTVCVYRWVSHIGSFAAYWLLMMMMMMLMMMMMMMM